MNKRLFKFLQFLFYISALCISYIGILELSGNSLYRPSKLLHASLPEPYVADQAEKLGIEAESLSPDYLCRSISFAGSKVLLPEVYTEPFLKNYKKGRFYPHFISSQVWLIHNAPPEVPASYAELRDSKMIYAFSKDEKYCSSVVNAAFAFSDDAKLELSTVFFKKLRDEGRFIADFSPAELMAEPDPQVILSLPDFKAVAMIKAGYPGKIMLPEEGSLSLCYGLYSLEDDENYVTPKAPDDRLLLDSGLRLLNGEGDPKYYGPACSADKLTAAEDYEYFLNICRSTSTIFRRRVLEIRKFTTASGPEHIFSYLVAAMLVMVWGGYMLWRVPEARNRYRLGKIIFLLILWILIRIIKIFSFEDIERYAWYFYHIIMNRLSCSYLEISLSLELEKTELNEKIYRYSRIGSLIFTLIYITNDLHNAVFVLPPGCNDISVYDYGPFFFLGSAYIFLLFAFSIYNMIKSTKRRRNLPLTFVFIGLTLLFLNYVIAYALDFGSVRDSEISFVWILYVMTLLEITVSAGFLSNNRYYSVLFTNSLLPISLFNKHGDFVESSLSAATGPNRLSTADFKELRRKAENREKQIKLGQGIDDNVSVFTAKVSGGYVCWQYDLSSIRLLQAKLRRIKKSLEKQNLILAERISDREEASGMEKEKIFYASLEKALQPKLYRIESLGASLKKHSSDKEQTRKILEETLRNISFCKRVGLLRLKGEEDRMLPAGFLLRLLSESAADFCSDDQGEGLEIAVFGCKESKELISAAFCIDCLNLFDGFLNILIKDEPCNWSVFVTLNIRERKPDQGENHLQIKFMADKCGVINQELFADLKQENDIDYAIEFEEDSLVIEILHAVEEEAKAKTKSAESKDTESTQKAGKGGEFK